MNPTPTLENDTQKTTEWLNLTKPLPAGEVGRETKNSPTGTPRVTSLETTKTDQAKSNNHAKTNSFKNSPEMPVVHSGDTTLLPPPVKSRGGRLVQPQSISQNNIVCILNRTVAGRTLGGDSNHTTGWQPLLQGGQH